MAEHGELLTDNLKRGINITDNITGKRQWSIVTLMVRSHDFVI